MNNTDAPDDVKAVRVRKCLHVCGVDGETGESVELADVGWVFWFCPHCNGHVDDGTAEHA
ncbi:hypothetical protein AB42_5095 [Escherichia coli 1-392-07_S1_C2]|nr:hypothetical protein AB42_5095 [Escherichia coli 1-392-07_S1_C2]